MQTKGEKKFSSKLGFILASAGSAIGMGNIWMFPYRVGKYGGAAFLLAYFIFIVLFGAIGLSGEFALGRLTGTGPIGSYEHALQSRGKKGGAFLGSIPLFGSLGIAIGYAIIVGWVLRFLAGSITGSLFQSDPSDYFASITGSFGSIPWHLLVLAMTAAALLFGIIKGIEKVSKFMMPAFFVLFIIIAIRVAFLPGAIEGYKYLLLPKWEYLKMPITWIMAMGQAFFSLSITGSGMIIYGSYLNKDEDVVHSSLMTALLDTCAALLAAFAIIPAVFAFGLDPTAGPPLMFISMPKIFTMMPVGRLFSAFFFLSVLFAGVTSLINMLEVCSEAAQSRLKVKRSTAIIGATLITAVVGIFLEYEPYMGRWMDMITIYVVPFGALLGAIIIYYVLQPSQIHAEMNSGRKKVLGNWFWTTARFIYVPITLIVFILSLIYKGIG